MVKNHKANSHSVRYCDFAQDNVSVAPGFSRKKANTTIAYLPDYTIQCECFWQGTGFLVFLLQ
jgi:hypothetical protein